MGAYINGKHTTVNVNVYGEIPETASGTVIYAVSMGLSRDCVVGRDYASELNEFVYPENIKAGDYMIDGDSACWFQYCELEEDGASLGGYGMRVICVANPNGKPAEGAMVFKGVVDALPETANEGDVYKLDAAWKNLGSFSSAQYNVELSYYSFAVNNENGLPDSIAHIDENFVEGTTYKIVTPEREYTYANCNGKDWGSVNTTIYGEIEEGLEDEYVSLNNDTVTIYEYDPNATSSLYVYHNGEWV